MKSQSAYLFLELAILAYALGVGWEHTELKRMFSPRFAAVALLLALFWFCVDQVAVGLEIWDFPNGGTLPFRLLSLPFEEYLLFFVHTIICFFLLQQYLPAR